MDDLWNRIEELMTGYTSRYLSEQTNIPETTISTWRTKKTVPRADELVKIAKFLKTTVEYLITGEYADGLTPEQRNLLQLYDMLDERDRQTVTHLVGNMVRKYSISEIKKSSKRTIQTT
jgi:transcriptional regulator with XRE-family HTH domain